MTAYCAFCEIIAGRGPADIVAHGEHTITIVPLGPVTEGHVLVIPRRHVANAAESVQLSGHVMKEACEYAATRLASFNIITSKGVAATQTVGHLHLHVVPRHAGDGLHLPWTGQGGES